eukprot:c5226_g1_i2.p1 GENE.c5226_g1_i2~~c5226_g1_i2.p1  ORF type:complete len:475 (-),score=125.49 c5226_g1_i2:20-1444(-)
MAVHLQQVLDRGSAFTKENTSADPHAVLARYHANLQLRLLGDVNKSREIWNEILVGHSSNQFLWKECILIEQAFGHYDRVRELFGQASEKLSNSGSVSALFTDWLRFEGESGSLDDYLKVVELSENRPQQEFADRTRPDNRRQIQKNDRDRDDRSRQQKRPTKYANDDTQKRDNSKKPTKDTTKSKPAKDAPVKDRKTNQKRTKETNERDTSAKDKKTVKGAKRTRDDSQSEQINIEEQPNQKSKRPRDENVQPAMETDLEAPLLPPPASAPEPTVPATPQTLTKHLSTSKDRQLGTVFISNVRKTATKQEIQALFDQCGTVKEIRLVSGTDGIFKGYGYIEFEDDSAVDKALALNETKFQGKAVKVKPSLILDESSKKQYLQTKQQIKPQKSEKSEKSEKLATEHSIKPVVAFVPRGVMRRKAVNVTTNSTSATTTAPTTATSGSEQPSEVTEAQAPVQKSNSDFRKMFGLGN